MERYFFRSRSDAAKKIDKEQIRIGVTGIGQGVGTTFVASALAFYFRDQGKSVSFTQCLDPKKCTGLLYDAVAMDKRFAHRSFYDIYQCITDGQPIRRKRNRETGIFWNIPTPQNCLQGLRLDEKQQGRLIGNADGEVCIYDVEADYSWDSFLLDMDLIVAVVDPLPSRLIRAKDRFRQLKKMELSGCPVVWIVNKVTSGINKKQVRDYLKTSKILWLEAVEMEQIYKDEYLCRFHWENQEIQRKLLEIFTKVSQF